MRVFNRVKLSGHICTIRLTAYSPYPKEGWDENALGWLKTHRDSLEGEIKEEVRAVLGPQFTVQQIEYYKGSIEVSVIIATAGVVYYAISRYKNFVESLDLLVYHLRKVLHRFAGPMDSQVSGGWFPGPEMVHVPESVGENRTDTVTLVLILYLIFSNAALLTLLMWLLLKR